LRRRRRNRRRRRRGRRRRRMRRRRRRRRVGGVVLEHCSRKSGLFSTQKFWRSCNWLERGGCFLRCGG
jgi:hypothetical protein